MPSSIYHFFVALLQNRGYFPQFQNLEVFDFPETLIAARGGGRFPDLVLRYDASEEITGGEFVELKTAKSFSIPSFNSTLPSAQKPMSVLSQSIRAELRAAGETFELDDERPVYYLILGRKRERAAPRTKVCLVEGSFFESISTKEALLQAVKSIFDQDSAVLDEELRRVLAGATADAIQAKFASNKSAPGSSISLRFRVMAEAQGNVNLLRQSLFPDIIDDSISMISPLSDLESRIEHSLLPWDEADSQLQDTVPYFYLSSAVTDIEPNLREILSIGTLAHPIAGKYFLARALIH